MPTVNFDARDQFAFGFISQRLVRHPGEPIAPDLTHEQREDLILLGYQIFDQVVSLREKRIELPRISDNPTFGGFGKGPRVK